MNEPSNPYQAPSAALPQDKTWTASHVGDARRVRALNGARWVTEGITILMHGVTGFVLTFLFMLIPWGLANLLALGLATINPLLASLPGLLITPIFTVFWGGMMAGCEHRPFKAVHAIRAMRRRFWPLFILGVLSTLFLVLMVAFGVALTPLRFDSMQVATGAEAVGIFAVIFFLFACYMSTVWFSPALVTIGKMAPHTAMSRSVAACFKNFLPFLVLTILGFLMLIALLLLIALVGGIAFGLLDVADNFALGGSSGVIQFGVFALINGLLSGLFIAFLIATQYCSFRDVFARRIPN